MSDMEIRGGSLEHLSESGLKSLIRDLQARIWDSEAARDELKKELEAADKRLQGLLKISNGHITIEQVEAQAEKIEKWRANFQLSHDECVKWESKAERYEKALREFLNEKDAHCCEDCPCGHWEDAAKSALGAEGGEEK